MIYSMKYLDLVFDSISKVKWKCHEDGKDKESKNRRPEHGVDEASSVQGSDSSVLRRRAGNKTSSLKTRGGGKSAMRSLPSIRRVQRIRTKKRRVRDLG